MGLFDARLFSFPKAEYGSIETVIRTRLHRRDDIVLRFLCWFWHNRLML